jgi:hypothetical protein
MVVRVVAATAVPYPHVVRNVHVRRLGVGRVIAIGGMGGGRVLHGLRMRRVVHGRGAARWNMSATDLGARSPMPGRRPSGRWVRGLVLRRSSLRESHSRSKRDNAQRSNESFHVVFD